MVIFDHTPTKIFAESIIFRLSRLVDVNAFLLHIDCRGSHAHVAGVNLTGISFQIYYSGAVKLVRKNLSNFALFTRLKDSI